MNKLRIVFMGTPEFAVPSLDHLVKNKYSIVGVITAPDKPAGRGRQPHASAIKKYAQAEGLHLLQPTNLKDEDFLKELKSLNANVQVVVAFRMLPKEVWQMPDLGTFNLHASLLPDYRGAAPINWAIMNGETETGLTTFFIDEKMDTGELIFQKRTAIGPDETVGNLHDRLMFLGADLVLKTIKSIEAGKVIRKVQGSAKELNKAPKLSTAICKIKWNKSLEDIHNHIRGLSPYPAAWTYLRNDDQELLIKIYKATKEVARHNLEYGSLIATKKDLRVAVKGGFLYLEEIQLAGKRKMHVKDVLNGLKLNKNAQMC